MTAKSLLERTARHLQLDMSLEEYDAFRDQYCRSDGKRSLPYTSVSSFWERIPKYLIARCPLCGACYTERMDTYGLEHWIVGLDDAVYRSAGYRNIQNIGCGHFAGVQSYINLNGIMPTELTRYRSSKPEVPRVMPIFLPDDPESYVVMHSLPICRVEENEFVPRYSLFMLTYYSRDPRVLIERNKEHWKPGMGMISLMYSFSSDDDLPKWVVAGKLWWLDIDQDDLPLKSGPVQEFPYGGIEGRDRQFTLRMPRGS